MRSFIFITSLLLFVSLSAGAQDQAPELIMDFEKYDPPSTLVVPENPKKSAKYPFIDIHNHQWRMNQQDLSELTGQMNDLNMGVMINLSGRGRGSRGYFMEVMENVNKSAPNRFVIFTNIQFDDIDDPNWSKNTAQQIADDVRDGAQGLKIYKSLGLRDKDKNGSRIAIDDPRIDAVWAKCGELGIPVLIHSADPKPFWDPMDANNERWLELKTRSGRQQADSEVSWEQIIAEQHRVFAKHPKTTFINAHFGWYANDLATLGKLLEQYPNMMIEIGAIIAELGRQPRAAKAFFIKYQDRVLFGKDAYNPEEYYTYFRVLETADEYFPYYKKYHAFWKMYGLDLPDDVLRKLYYKNALRILPGIKKDLFKEWIE
jgi:predicted TIM-barrel fold metal-dependent hydrolase